MTNIFYTSRVLVKCCTKEIVCAHRLLKIRGNIGPIAFVLLSADADNTRFAWPSPPLHASQTIHSFTSSFQSGWRPTDSSSIHPSLNVHGAPPSGVAIYITAVS